AHETTRGAARLHRMEILEQQPRLLVCHQSATYMRAFGGIFITIGIGAIVAMANADSINVHGPRFIAYFVGAMFVFPGVAMVVTAEDDRIVLDGAAHVARIMRRGLFKRSTTEVPFASITDVALEVSTSNGSSGGARTLTFRPVFVCADGSRVPWTPMSTSSRAPQAQAVAAARTMGGWNALPVEGSPVVARAAT